MANKFRVKARRSRPATRELIVNMARHGKHGRGYGLKNATEQDVAHFFAKNGFDFKKVVEETRESWLAHVPLLWVWEPLSFNMGVSPGGYGAIKAGDKVLASLEGESGRFVLVEYGDRFEQATKHLHRSIDDADHGDFLSAISDGISSLEAFLNYSASRYSGELSDTVHNDKGSRKLTFDEMVERWIPQITGGRKLDKSGRNWNDHKKLREIRNEFQSHPKTHVYGVSFRELNRGLNLFRTGIAGLLIDLHAVLQTTYVPEIVFRYAYLPDIEYVEEE